MYNKIGNGFAGFSIHHFFKKSNKRGLLAPISNPWRLHKVFCHLSLPLVPSLPSLSLSIKTPNKGRGALEVSVAL